MIYFARGSESDSLDKNDLKEGLISALDKIKEKKKVLIIPPDITRFHSRAGELTEMAWKYLGNNIKTILPALGTHTPMTLSEIKTMFGATPHQLFMEHNWREDIISLGNVPKSFVEEVSDGKVRYSWPAEVNKILVTGGYDLILSIGQVVPHEVVGMANYNKNIFIGTGGAEGINKSHFLGAAYGMEKMMGRADTPVRRVLNYASKHFGSNLPVVYVLTVVESDKKGKLITRGLFIGDDEECFLKASELSLGVNFNLLSKPEKKIVVYLNPEEFRSTWLGNKAIYRTRMALADGGELVILAPGLKEFGEDRRIDSLIRKYGYLKTPAVLELTEKNQDLQENLSAAAHLIHGSSEGRFKITYAPGFLSKKEIEGVGYNYAQVKEMLRRYNPDKLNEGHNTLSDGEEIYYISNPALGLWAAEEKFKEN